MFKGGVGGKIEGEGMMYKLEYHSNYEHFSLLLYFMLRIDKFNYNCVFNRRLITDI